MKTLEKYPFAAAIVLGELLIAIEICREVGFDRCLFPIGVAMIVMGVTCAFAKNFD